jgi:hypothetical protein
MAKRKGPDAGGAGGSAAGDDVIRAENAQALQQAPSWWSSASMALSWCSRSSAMASPDASRKHDENTLRPGCGVR